MSPLMLVVKTYKFVILRLLVATLFLVPVLYAPEWGLNLYVGLFGETTKILNIMAMYVSLVATYAVLKWVSTFLLHLIQFIHTASMTLLIKNQGNGRASGVFSSLALTASRLGSVSILLLADSLITESYKKLINWWINLNNIPKILKSGLLFYMLKKSVETIVLNISETVVSYLFYNTEEKFFKGTARAMLYMAKSWKSIIKKTFLYTLIVTCLIALLDVIVLVYIIVDKWNLGLQAIVYSYLIAKIIIHLVKTALVEPVLTASMLSGFYENSSIDQLDDDEINTLVDRFPKFESHLLRKDKRTKAVQSITEAIQDLVPDDLKNISESVEKFIPRGARSHVDIPEVTEESVPVNE